MSYVIILCLILYSFVTVCSIVIQLNKALLSYINYCTSSSSSSLFNEESAPSIYRQVMGT